MFITYAADHVRQEVSGRRKTKNSRGPGQDGNVRRAVRALVRCDECGTLWVGGGVHGMRVLPGGERVGCVGQTVAP